MDKNKSAFIFSFERKYLRNTISKVQIIVENTKVFIKKL